MKRTFGLAEVVRSPIRGYTAEAWQAGRSAPLGVFDAATGDLLVDCWIGSARPGGVTHVTPPEFEGGSLAARRAEVFGAPHPMLPLEGVRAVLRPTTGDDSPAIVARCADPGTARGTPLAVPAATCCSARSCRRASAGGGPPRAGQPHQKSVAMIA